MPDDKKALISYDGPEERRQIIRELKMKGYKPSIIMRSLGLSKSQFYRDEQELKKDASNLVLSSDAATEIGENLMFLDTIEQMSVGDYFTAENDAGKKGYLDAALKARKQRIDLQLASGMIPRAPDRMQIEILRTMTNLELDQFEESLMTELKTVENIRNVEARIIPDSDDGKQIGDLGTEDHDQSPSSSVD